MNLNLNKKTFKQFITKISIENKIDEDIIEKDYYVCCILEELSKVQDDLQTYFKGGTAIYKILNNMHRFSEDIDLTVKGVLEEESKTSAKKRLIKSVLNYNVNGLALDKSSINRIKDTSLIANYNYNSMYKLENDLQRFGRVMIEATSYTVSEPFDTYVIEPLIYKLASDNEKEILKQKFEVSSFNINVIKIERMFVDKIFAAEYYYVRNEYFDTSKHIYDLTVLFNYEPIKKLLSNKEEINQLINCKRIEEKSRKGGISDEIKLQDFEYLKLDFDTNMENAFKSMQKKYVFKDEFKISIDEVKNILSKLLDILYKYDI